MYFMKIIDLFTLNVFSKNRDLTNYAHTYCIYFSYNLETTLNEKEAC